MLKFPGGIASHVPPSPYKKVEFLSHLQARNDLLKDLFLQESNPRVGLPSVVTGYNGKRQQILAGLDVLVSDQQTRQLRIMAEAFDAASMGQVLDLLNRADEEDAKKVRL
jgi:predicted ATP-dependent serine protease